MEQDISIRKDLFDIKENLYSDSSPEEISDAAKNWKQEALFYMALSFFYGVGCPKDYKQSYEWAAKAADRNQARAQCLLGVCRAMGLGVSQDFSVMLYWFHKAAEQRDVGGLYYLAGMLVDYAVR